MAFYYGFAHTYGSDIVSADDGKPIGYVVVFGSKSERDRWVDADFGKRSECSAAAAKHFMACALRTWPDYGKDYAYYSVHDIVRYMRTANVVADYLDLMGDDDI